MTATKARGWWYPWIFVGGMLVVVVVNGIMIYLATSTFTGIQTENPYERGLAYNKTLAENRAQAEMGWTADVVFEAGAAGTTHGGRLNVTYRDRDGKPIEGLRVEARLLRPTSASHDRTIPLAAGAPGVYGAALDMPLPGIWDVRLTAARGDRAHREGHRITVP